MTGPYCPTCRHKWWRHDMIDDHCDCGCTNKEGMDYYEVYTYTTKKNVRVVSQTERVSGEPPW